MSKSYTKREAQDMLVALERQAREIIIVAQKAQSTATKHSFNVYRQFRESVSEFETFGILIENRLRNLDTGRDPRLDEQFDALNVLISKSVIKASTQFFLALSKSPALPLGSREVFLQELRSLHEARNKLSDPRYQRMLDEEAHRNLQIAENILTEIIERAPSLLDFNKRQSA